MDTIASWVLAAVDWCDSTKLSVMEILVYGLIAVIIVAVIVTIIKDEPLAYRYYADGSVYAYCIRRGKIKIQEGRK